MGIGPPRMGSTVARFSFPVGRRRYGPSVPNADGLMVAPVVLEDTIMAHAFPAPGATMQRLAELQITGRAIEVHTRADLRLADTATATRGDVINYDGADFEATTLAEWTGGSAGARDYRAVVCVEVDRP